MTRQFQSQRKKEQEQQKVIWVEKMLNKRCDCTVCLCLKLESMFLRMSPVKPCSAHVLCTVDFSVFNSKQSICRSLIRRQTQTDTHPSFAYLTLWLNLFDLHMLRTNVAVQVFLLRGPCAPVCLPLHACVCVWAYRVMKTGTTQLRRPKWKRTSIKHIESDVNAEFELPAFLDQKRITKCLLMFPFFIKIGIKKHVEKSRTRHRRTYEKKTHSWRVLLFFSPLSTRKTSVCWSSLICCFVMRSKKPKMIHHRFMLQFNSMWLHFVLLYFILSSRRFFHTFSTNFMAQEQILTFKQISFSIISRVLPFLQLTAHTVCLSLDLHVPRTSSVIT